MRAPIVIEVVDAERHRHPPHRAEEVDRDRERASACRSSSIDVLEQQRLAAAGLLHHAVGDLAQLEIRPTLAAVTRTSSPAASSCVDEFGESVEASRGTRDGALSA